MPGKSEGCLSEPGLTGSFNPTSSRFIRNIEVGMGVHEFTKSLLNEGNKLGGSESRA